MIISLYFASPTPVAPPRSSAAQGFRDQVECEASLPTIACPPLAYSTAAKFAVAVVINVVNAVVTYFEEPKV